MLDDFISMISMSDDFFIDAARNYNTLTTSLQTPVCKDVVSVLL